MLPLLNPLFWKINLKTWVLGNLILIEKETQSNGVVYRLVQDVASKTNEIAGDGTTTATVLTRAIFTEGVKNVAAGCNPMDLRRGAQMAVDAVVDFLKSHTKVITTPQEVAQVKWMMTRLKRL